jgi:hypothetical protein
VCIRFDRAKLIKVFMRHSLTAKSVRYLTLDEIRKKILKINELPFRKRFGYKDEREFRVIYESTITKKKTFDVAIPLGSIDRITLGPSLPDALKSDLKEMIHNIRGCKNIEVVRSTLISNKEWKNHGQNAK